MQGGESFSWWRQVQTFWRLLAGEWKYTETGITVGRSVNLISIRVTNIYLIIHIYFVVLRHGNCWSTALVSFVFFNFIIIPRVAKCACKFDVNGRA